MKSTFQKISSALIARLESASSLTNHGSSKGDAVEDEWIGILRETLPARYQVESGFVMDSEGGESRQIDCLIFDAFYTPKLWGQNKYLYVPAEAVYAAIEIKQIVDKPNLLDAQEKIASVRALKRTSLPMISSGKKVGAREQFRIVGGLCAINAKWKDGLGASFKKLHREISSPLNGEIDFYLTAKSGVADVFDGDIKLNTSAAAAVYGLFRLVERIKELGTVSAIDLSVYYDHAR